MEITLVKASGPGDRDRAYLTARGIARRAAVQVAHDLPHLADESAFGITDGLWPELSDGSHAEAGRAATARDPRRHKHGRIVSGTAAGVPAAQWLTAGTAVRRRSRTAWPTSGLKARTLRAEYASAPPASRTFRRRTALELEGRWSPATNVDDVNQEYLGGMLKKVMDGMSPLRKVTSCDSAVRIPGADSEDRLRCALP